MMRLGGSVLSFAVISALTTVACVDSARGPGTRTPAPDAGGAEDTGPPADTGLGPTADAGAVTTPDSGTVTGTTCAERLRIDESFQIDPNGQATQIHAAAAFDGQGIWFAYNRPGANRLFDVYATRVACDGGHLVAPFRVTQAAGRNDTEPQIAVAGDRVVIVWQSDDQSGADNLSLFVRTYDRDGQAQTPERSLKGELTRNGQAQSGNTWMPALVATEDGFAVAGSWAHDEAARFQVFVQLFDHAGQPAGEAMDARLEPTTSQLFPALTAGADGSLLVAWTRSPDQGDEQVYLTRFTRGSTVATDTASVAAGTTGAGLHTTPGGQTYLSFNGATPDPQVVLMDAHRLGPGAPSLSIGAAGRVDHGGAAAGDGIDGVVAYYRQTSGIRNQVFLQYFERAPGGFALGSERIVPAGGPAAPYSIVLLGVAPGTYFVAWSEGVSPDFFIHGRFTRASR